MADVVYLVKDLLFSSKIREIAAQVGVGVEPFRDAAKLAEGAKGAKLVILDLRLSEAMDALDRLHQASETRDIESVGFVDHEKVDLMDAASARGCRRVMAKGRFTQELAVILGSLT